MAKSILMYVTAGAAGGVSLLREVFMALDRNRQTETLALVFFFFFSAFVGYHYHKHPKHLERESNYEHCLCNIFSGYFSGSVSM